MAGTVPLRVRLVKVSPPAAAATLLRPLTVVTEDSLMAASVGLPLSVLVSILVPAAGRLEVPVRNPNPNEPEPADPAVGVLVTVASVPTP